MKVIQVVKRDGRLEDVDHDKILKVCSYVCDGVEGVSSSKLSITTFKKLYDGITTKDLHDCVIRSAVELIDEDVRYDVVAAKAYVFKIRKDIYGTFEVPHLENIVKDNVKRGVYTEDLLYGENGYSSEELEELNNYICHERDATFSYAAITQMMSKYLVQDRSSNTVYETPQVLYMLVGATLFSQYPKESRLQYVKDYYDSQSLHKHSIPTPIAAGARTPVKQFSSCVGVKAGDSLDEIDSAGGAIIKYVSQKAGIGLHFGDIRAEGSKVGSGTVKHTGLLPFIKKFKGDLKSCSQGGVRGGAATGFYPWWHLEFPELIVLKNNQGTEESRERHIDYGVEFNKLIIDRFKRGENVTLFSPHEVPKLKEAFYSDNCEAFEKVYCEYENLEGIRKRVVSAYSIIRSFILERTKTGRIYPVFLDNMYRQGPIERFEEGSHYQSNLCLEIALPSKAFTDKYDEKGLIFLCTLSSYNMGLANCPEDLEKPCRIMVRALDALLDYQEYPMVQAETFTKKYRALGVGVVGFAHFLARRGLKYNKDALNTVDEYMEAFTYYLTDESANIATEKGSCEAFEDTCYAQGVFPWEKRHSNVDKLVSREHTYPWEVLREKVKRGMRNAFLTAIAPTESSSQLLNETNGIEPPRSAISLKSSKDGRIKQVVPEYLDLKDDYDYLWDQKSPKGYLMVTAVMQKWVDQSISANTSYNPEHYFGGKIPLSELIEDLLMAYETGHKTLYYSNINDTEGGSSESSSEMITFVDTGEVCEGCVI